MKPLFVNGYSKSGTSLLTALFDGHSKITVIPEESDYFDSHFFTVEKFMNQSLGNVDKQIETILLTFRNYSHIRNLFAGKRESDPRGNFDYSDLDTDKFSEVFRSTLKSYGVTHVNVFNSLAKAYAAGIGSSKKSIYWLEKTPYHDLNVSNREDLMNNYFEDYKSIHIFRDPRDNYLAYIKKQPSLTIHDICYQWNRISKLALNWRNTEQNLIVRYEDLVIDTKGTMKRILAFLDIEEEKVLYSPTKNSIPWSGNSMFGEKSTTISSSRLERYKKIMDDKTRSIIENNCGDGMKALGYLPEDFKVPPKSTALKMAAFRATKNIWVKKLKLKWVLR